MPTIRDLRGRPVDDEVHDLRDVHVVAERGATKAVAASAPWSEASNPPAAPSAMPEGPGAATVWQPWEQFTVDVTRLAEEPLPVAGPPCAGCVHWKPRRMFADFQYQGVRLCWAEDMNHDFSCFVRKDTAT